jgi:hypothetical protein
MMACRPPAHGPYPVRYRLPRVSRDVACAGKPVLVWSYASVVLLWHIQSSSLGGLRRTAQLLSGDVVFDTKRRAVLSKTCVFSVFM